MHSSGGDIAEASKYGRVFELTPLAAKSIQHNLEVSKTADWIIDLGPEGGDGEIVASGTPEDVVRARSAVIPGVLQAGARHAVRWRAKSKKCVEAAE